MGISQAEKTTVPMPTIDKLKYRVQARKLEELEVSCEDYKTQVTCLLEEIDEQKRKIYTLEKLLKLYL